MLSCLFFFIFVFMGRRVSLGYTIIKLGELKIVAR